MVLRNLVSFKIPKYLGLTLGQWVSDDVYFDYIPIYTWNINNSLIWSYRLERKELNKLEYTVWMANYDRLPTRSRLVSWGLPIPITCPFCSRCDETRDHLLLSCLYSKDVWRLVLSRCRSSLALITTWSELLSWIRSSPSRKLTLLRKLATQSVIFHIWSQRNNLIHNQTSIPAERLFQIIDRQLRNIISARRHRKSFSNLISMWLS